MPIKDSLRGGSKTKKGRVEIKVMGYQEIFLFMNWGKIGHVTSFQSKWHSTWVSQKTEKERGEGGGNTAEAQWSMNYR